jgi:Ca-activated chloride channel family protein
MAYGDLRSLATGRATLRTAFRWLPDLLRLAAAMLLALAIGRPQVLTFDARTVEGIDIFVALDLSGSMRGIDMDPADVQAYAQANQAFPPNRFESAVQTLETFVKGRERDRIGMVVFARDAFMQFPLTLDYSTVLTLLGQLSLDTIDSSATAIGNGLGLAVRGLIDSSATSKAIVLVTDGKQLGGNISPKQAAELAHSKGIRIFTILVGREGEATVPVQQFGSWTLQQQAFGADPEALKEIARIADGEFYRAENKAELERDLNGILDKLERTRVEDIASASETEVFGGFLAVALALLVLEAILGASVLRRYP